MDYLRGLFSKKNTARTIIYPWVGGSPDGFFAKDPDEYEAIPPVSFGTIDVNVPLTIEFPIQAQTLADLTAPAPVDMFKEIQGASAWFRGWIEKNVPLLKTVDKGFVINVIVYNGTSRNTISLPPLKLGASDADIQPAIDTVVAHTELGLGATLIITFLYQIQDVLNDADVIKRISPLSASASTSGPSISPPSSVTVPSPSSVTVPSPSSVTAPLPSSVTAPSSMPPSAEPSSPRIQGPGILDLSDDESAVLYDAVNFFPLFPPTHKLIEVAFDPDDETPVVMAQWNLQAEKPFRVIFDLDMEYLKDSDQPLDDLNSLTKPLCDSLEQMVEHFGEVLTMHREIDMNMRAVGFSGPTHDYAFMSSTDAGQTWNMAEDLIEQLKKTTGDPPLGELTTWLSDLHTFLGVTYSTVISPMLNRAPSISPISPARPDTRMSLSTGGNLPPPPRPNQQGFIPPPPGQSKGLPSPPRPNQQGVLPPPPRPNQQGFLPPLPHPNQQGFLPPPPGTETVRSPKQDLNETVRRKYLENLALKTRRLAEGTPTSTVPIPRQQQQSEWVTSPSTELTRPIGRTIGDLTRPKKHGDSESTLSRLPSRTPAPSPSHPQQADRETSHSTETVRSPKQDLNETVRRKYLENLALKSRRLAEGTPASTVPAPRQQQSEWETSPDTETTQRPKRTVADLRRLDEQRESESTTRRKSDDNPRLPVQDEWDIPPDTETVRSPQQVRRETMLRKVLDDHTSTSRRLSKSTPPPPETGASVAHSTSTPSAVLTPKPPYQPAFVLNSGTAPLPRGPGNPLQSLTSSSSGPPPPSASGPPPPLPPSGGDPSTKVTKRSGPLISVTEDGNMFTELTKKLADRKRKTATNITPPNQ